MGRGRLAVRDLRRPPGEQRRPAAPVEAIFRQKTVDDWLGQLSAGSIPCGPINDVGAALVDEQTAARNLVVTTDHPRYGEVRQLASPVRVGDETPTYRRAPQRNEDLALVTEEILGLDAQQVAALRAAGAFGDVPTPGARTPDSPDTTAAAAR